jgi:hypothetical protein
VQPRTEEPVATDATGSVLLKRVLICSAKGCRNAAAVELRWNNPKLHPPERRKVWLACPEHRDHLADFLSARGFLRETVAVSE